MTYDSDIPRLLLIDSYDSFTFNLAALCRQSLPNCSIIIIKNDDYTIEQLLPYLSYFSAIIIGPGPGSPDNDEDIGVAKHLWRISNDSILPIFGVCLGLQSLAIEHGATLHRLKVVKHGQISHIHHTGEDLFAGIDEVHAVRYHSLHVELAKDGEIEPLAWAVDEFNGKVLMAARHKTKPFWAVQYHPESVCTRGGGADVVRNFWIFAQLWTKKHGRRIQPWYNLPKTWLTHAWPCISQNILRFSSPDIVPTVSTTTLRLPNLSTTIVCDIFGAAEETSHFALLESSAQPGRFSIVASLMADSVHITYSIGDSAVRLTQGKNSVYQELESGDIWSWIAAFMRSKQACNGLSVVPFWGGLIGYLSYELGVQSLDISVKKGSDCRHSDVNLVFVERSVVLDSLTGDVFVQSLIPCDDAWISETSGKLITASNQDKPVIETKLGCQMPPSATLPCKARYISRVNQAKEHLFAGDSYELCLTAQTRISVPHTLTSSSWEQYKRLRSSNPAPHSAYLRLHPTTLLASSPERFLSVSRSPDPVFQLRPIKGTVMKGPGMTREKAENALSGSIKEVAENLMIVDLIRHDLHAVVGEDVTVKQFCGVEEYETVWQLVSVIEGRASSSYRPIVDAADERGWEVLRKSLPPGSMTGAPKKRSVEILQTLEDQERGVYSGVFGYWCVSGAGDWSVTIRSCFKFDDSPSNDAKQTGTAEWFAGAGGAITALSDPESEWEEMVTKLQSVLTSFGVIPRDLS